MLLQQGSASQPLHWMERATFWIVVMTATWPIAYWAYRRWYDKPRTFRLTFYSTRGRAERTKWIFPIGKTECDILIAVRRPLYIARCNVRFVETKRGDNVDQAIIQIEGFKDAERPSRVPGLMRGDYDGKGGIEVKYEPPMFRSPSEVIRFRLTVIASEHWSGFLSFRCYDEDGHPRFARVPCEVDPSL